MNIRIVLAVVLALCTQPWLTASAAQPQLSGYATTGYEYDSNVSIDAIDSNTGESDSAWVIDLGIDATVPVSTHSKLLFGYAYNGTRYQDFPEFDLAIHHIYGGIGHSFRGFDGELAVNRFVARLDDAGFVDITYVPLSVSRLIGMRWYLRGSVAHTRKDYAELDERNADSNTLRADAYYLIDGMQRYLSVSMQHEREDAFSQSYDYDSNRARLLYGHKLRAGSRALQLKAHAQYEIRDYAADASSPALAPRRDKRAGVGLEAILAVTDHFEVSAVMDYADTRSTLTTADYAESRYSINAGFRFQ